AASTLLSSRLLDSGLLGSKLLDPTTNLREIRTFAMRQQPLDLGDDRADVAEFTLQVRARGVRVGRPRLGDKARTRTDAQCRDGLSLTAPQRDRLADQARLRRDGRRGVGGGRICRVPRQRTL